MAAPPGLSDDEKNNIDIYQRYSPGVVNITTTTLALRFLLRPVPRIRKRFRERLSTLPDTSLPITTSSPKPDRLEVTLWNRRASITAEVVGETIPTMISRVIQIDAPEERTETGSARKFRRSYRSDKSLAIGNPVRARPELTTGIISSLGRAIQERRTGAPSMTLIQTDAAINPGNSGGPAEQRRRNHRHQHGDLFRVRRSVGIGFAIPSTPYTKSPAILSNSATCPIRISDVTQPDHAFNGLSRHPRSPSD